MIKNGKIVLIGCGNVGMAYAYALLNQKNYCNELILVDLDIERIKGEASDLSHGLPFAPNKIDIKVGNYKDCFDAELVVIAAGANQSPGETRMDLIEKNSNIFEKIVTEVMRSGFDGIFLVATNPLDVMTYITWKYSKLPTNKVIGSGTSLDTARLRYKISEKVNMNSKNIHAYVMGEHGDSEFVPWSIAKVGAEDINVYLNEDEKIEIENSVRNAAYEIIKQKGSTYYGIGMCLARITNAILGDENTVITVSSYDETNEVFIGGPTILNKDGVKKRVYIKLTEQEEGKLVNSINTIKKAINTLEII
ncbi:MAG: L-lactate dehydrogenase [Bacilli bacterium]|nr:L-lactate dehydrogenase [Bacilli bacterium]